MLFLMTLPQISVGDGIAIVVALLSLGKGLQQMKEYGKRLQALEDILESHLRAPSLHRSPDSELRWQELEKRLDRLDGKYDWISSQLSEILGKLSDQSRPNARR